MQTNPLIADDPNQLTAWQWLTDNLTDPQYDRVDEAQDILAVLQGRPVGDEGVLPGVGFNELSFDLLASDDYPENMVMVSFIGDTVTIAVAPFAQHLAQVLQLYQASR